MVLYPKFALALNTFYLTDPLLAWLFLLHINTFFSQRLYFFLLLSLKDSGVILFFETFVKHSPGLLRNMPTFNFVKKTFQVDIRAKYIFFVCLFACQKVRFSFHISQFRPRQEYCSYIWEKSSPTALNLLNSIYKIVIRIVNDPVLSVKLPSLGITPFDKQ